MHVYEVASLKRFYSVEFTQTILSLSLDQQIHSTTNLKTSSLKPGTLRTISRLNLQFCIPKIVKLADAQIVGGGLNWLKFISSNLGVSSEQIGLKNLNTQTKKLFLVSLLGQLPGSADLLFKLPLDPERYVKALVKMPKKPIGFLNLNSGF